MEQFGQRLLVQIRADDAEAAGIIGAAFPQINLSGNKVKLEPGSGAVLQNALRPQHPAVFLLVAQPAQDFPDFILFVPLRCFQTDGAEDLVRVMLTLVMVMVMMVIMIVMMMLIVVMVMMMFVLVVIVLIVVMVMVMMMFMLIVIVVVVVMVMFMIMVVVIMVVVMLMLIVIMVVMVIVFHRREVDGLALLNHFEHEVRIHLVPGCRNNPGIRMRLGNQQAALFHPVRRQQLRPAEITVDALFT